MRTHVATLFLWSYRTGYTSRVRYCKPFLRSFAVRIASPPLTQLCASSRVASFLPCLVTGTLPCGFSG